MSDTGRNLEALKPGAVVRGAIFPAPVKVIASVPMREALLLPTAVFALFSSAVEVIHRSALEEEANHSTIIDESTKKIEERIKGRCNERTSWRLAAEYWLIANGHVAITKRGRVLHGSHYEACS